MNLRIVGIIALCILALGSWSCGGPAVGGRSKAPTPASVAANKGYSKNVAVVLAGTPQSALGRRLGDLYLDTLLSTIRHKAPQLWVLTPEDPDFPEYMAHLAEGSGPADAEATLPQARHGGIHGLVTAAIADIHPVAKKTGIFWLRKMRYFIFFDTILDLYDPFSGAKLISDVAELSITVSQAEYEALRSGVKTTIASLNERIVDLARSLGGQVADTMLKQPWQTVVANVRQGRIRLPAGRQAGLAAGDRFAVFESRRTLKGGQGQASYVLWGAKIGEIRLERVTGDTAEAVVKTPQKIRAGDRIVPIN